MASSHLHPSVGTSTPETSDDASPRSITGRVVFLCLALAVFFGYVIPIVDVKFSNTFMGAQHLPPSAIGVLLALLLVVNPLLRLLSKRLAFSRGELLTVYISCLFSTLVPGHGGEGFFVSQIIAPFYYATRENKWLDLWHQYLPQWMTPALHADGGTYGPIGHQAVEGWFNQLPPGGTIPWTAWFVPLFAWATLIFAMYGALACLSVMLRAQWGDREALAFPLLRLPLEMTQDVDNADQYGSLGRFFKNPGLWIGVGIVVFVQLVNGLNLYFPDVPKIPLSLDMGPMLQESPWNQIGSVPIFVWPIVIGITYLLTSEVSFSLWFFYWFVKWQLVGAYLLGFSPATTPNGLQAWGKAFTSYQRIGAWIAYVALVLWAGREHFKHIARRAFGRIKATPEEKSEALSYPVAFWGFLFCSLVIVVWGWFAGVRPDITLAMWILSLVMLIGLTRLVVEGGILLMTPNWIPLGMLGQIFNSGPGTWLSPAAGLVPANFMTTALIGDPRAFSMPSFVQSFKLAHDHKIPARPLLALIFAVITITFAMSCWMRVRLGYENGGLSLGSWFFVKVGSQFPAWFSNDLLKGVTDASWTNAVWLAIGALFTFGLMAARARFPWFPLHPIGFLLSLTWAMEQIWFSIFIGWSCKVLITRFGGAETYRKTTPFFLGLALGDIAMILFWLIIDGWQGHRGHHLTPD
ncbi:hypothetical protein IAD21_05493 [Abditibacteriota bacterium]|nr:hypothetical protein IAD21_05493 [Abditibacteriota bacterium]